MKKTVGHKSAEKLRITVDPEVLGGDPVFAGTRVPVKTLFEHLEASCTLDEFWEWFPTVSREAAAAVLMAAHRLTVRQPRQ